MLMHCSSCKTFLSQELTRRIQVNPRYSQRAFARQLGISPGELSEILNGKRELSLKSALRVAQTLGLNPTETKHLIHLSQLDKQERRGNPGLLPSTFQAPSSQQLSLDMFHVISDWYCFTILNLMDCSDFKSDMDWIARRLGITKIEVSTAIEQLERLELIEKKNGKWVPVKDYVLTPSGIPSEAIRNYHRTLLKKASESLELQSIEERSITGISFAVSPSQLDSIKKDISEFQEKLIAQYSNSRSKKAKTEVYHLETALFRLTQKAPHGENDV